MDIGKAFGFIGEDENWVNKLGLGAIFAAIPFINFAVFGYQIQVARNVAAGEERPLPTWDDFGKYFLDGLRMIVPVVVLLLPIICLYFAAFIGFFAYIESGDPAVMANRYSGSEPPMEIFAMMAIMFTCVMPYSLFTYFVMPMFGIQIARKGTVASCFQVSEMWQLFRSQVGNYILIVLIMFGLYIGAAFVIMPVGLVLSFIPCIGTILYMFLYGAIILLTMVVTGHMQGQFIKASETPKSPDDYSDIVAFDA